MSKREILHEEATSNEQPSTSYEEVEQPKKFQTCTVCFGVRSCGVCGGSGSVYNAIDYSPGQYVTCSSCGGSGACSMCGGSGIIEYFGF